jgi:transposase InsO family protein
VTYDREEFIGHDFQDMLKNDYGIKRKPITVRNPQANAIVENSPSHWEYHPYLRARQLPRRRGSLKECSLCSSAINVHNAAEDLGQLVFEET